MKGESSKTCDISQIEITRNELIIRNSHFEKKENLKILLSKNELGVLPYIVGRLFE